MTIYMDDREQNKLDDLFWRLNELTERAGCIEDDLTDDGYDLEQMDKNIAIVKEFLCQIYEAQKLLLESLEISTNKVWQEVSAALSNAAKRLEDAICDSISAKDWYKMNMDSEEFHQSPYEYLCDATYAVDKKDAPVWERYAIQLLIYYQEPIALLESKPPEFYAIPKIGSDGLTDTESNIVEALSDATLTGRELSKIAGYINNSHYRSILSNLVKRGILSRSVKGYYNPHKVQEDPTHF